MKVRVRHQKGRPAIVLEASQGDLLRSLKLKLVEKGLTGDSCRLSLNGRDPLDENETLEQLDIVSGDLLHVIHGAEWASDVQPQSSAAQDTRGPSTDTQCSANTVLASGAGPQVLSHSLHQEEEKKRFSSSALETERGGQEDMEQGATGTQAMETAPSTEGVPSQEEMLPVATGGISHWVTGGTSHFEEFLQGHIIPAPCTCTSQSTAEAALSGSTPVSVLCMALHMLMLDSGYLLKEGPLHLTSSSGKWCYSTAISDQAVVYLACLRMGPLLTVHVSASVTHEDSSSHTLSCSHELNIAYYTKHSNMARPTLLNSAELSRVFKDNITHKLQTEIRKALGLPEVGTLTSLFPELKFLVFRLLDIRSFIAVSAVCKELNVVCQDAFLWKHFYLRDFGRVHNQKKYAWKQLYIQQYMAWKEMKRERQRHFDLLRRQQLESSLAVFPPLAQPFPGVIGGDYDLLPYPVASPPHVPGDPRAHMLPRRLRSPGRRVDWTSRRLTNPFTFGSYGFM